MIVSSSQETIDLGRKLGTLLEKGTTIVLCGDLACGKTTFTKGIGLGLDIKDTINSPTFTILKVYSGKFPLYHIDAYRLDKTEYDLGLNEFDDGVTVIEWPEYYKKYLINEYIKISFEYIDENTRKIEIDAIGDRYKKIVEKIND